MARREGIATKSQLIDTALGPASDRSADQAVQTARGYPALQVWRTRAGR